MLCVCLYACVWVFPLFLSHFMCWQISCQIQRTNKTETHKNPMNPQRVNLFIAVIYSFLCHVFANQIRYRIDTVCKRLIQAKWNASSIERSLSLTLSLHPDLSDSAISNVMNIMHWQMNKTQKRNKTMKQNEAKSNRGASKTPMTFNVLFCFGVCVLRFVMGRLFYSDLVEHISFY